MWRPVRTRRRPRLLTRAAGAIALGLVATLTGVGAAIGAAGPAATTAADDRETRLGPVVRLTAKDSARRPERFPRSYDALDGLEPGTVLQLRVHNFGWFSSARAMQCVTTVRTVCRNAIPVQFDADGTASFQYLVADDFAEAAREGRCRAGAAPCSIVVEEIDGDRRAEKLTIFHDPQPPPGRIQVTPRTGLEDGQAVTVEVERYPPGAEVQAMLCAAPDATGNRRCGRPGAVAPLHVGADGRGRTELVIQRGPVGSEHIQCGRTREPCGVSVASADVFARAPVVPITFAAPPGASYDPVRLRSGLVVAAVLLAVAAWLVRRTDWSPPGEAAAPEIDDAELADLDAIVAALPPEDDEDDAPRTGSTRR